MTCYLVEFETIIQNFSFSIQKERLSHFPKKMHVSSLVCNQKFSLPILCIRRYWFHLCQEQIEDINKHVKIEKKIRQKRAE
ncbi:hypothetical protein V2J09_012143 [Rumex salicifolius]